MTTHAGSKRDSSVGRGSCDSDNDFPCYQCMLDSCKNVESVVYCLECNEHLCATCRQIHRRVKVTRDHFLIHMGSDPVDGETELCEEHQGKMVRYFCDGHQRLCCISCVNMDHKMCENVTDINRESVGVKDSKELRECLSDLDRLITRFRDLKDFKERQNNDINKQTKGNKILVEKVRSDVNKVLEYLEEEAVSNADEVCENKIEANLNDSDNYQDEIRKVKHLANRLNVVKEIASETQVYITILQARKQMQRFTGILDNAEEDLTDVTVTFNEDPLFTRIIGKLVKLGIPVIEFNHLSKPPTPKSPRSVMRKKAVPIGGHSVHTKDDKTTCNVTSMAILPDGKLVLADYGNKRIKLFNPNFIFLDHLTISSRPLSIAVLKQTEIMVSSADDHCLLVFEIFNGLTQIKRIKTTDKYVSLATVPSIYHIFASCYHGNGEGRIHILDRNGRVQGILGQNDGSLTLVRPTTILLNEYGNLLFINDIGRNCVICVDVARFALHSIVFQYADRDLQLHDGVAVGDDGSVYVSSRDGSVHQLTSAGEKIHQILSSRNGINAPASLAICTMKNALYVAEQKHNSIKMFSIV